MKKHSPAKFLLTIRVTGKETRRIFGIKKPMPVNIKQNLIGIRQVLPVTGQIPIGFHPIPIGIR
jgi:hypothetical protein